MTSSDRPIWLPRVPAPVRGRSLSSRLGPLAGFVVALGLVASAAGAASIDGDLAAAIERVRAIDDQIHPQVVLPEGEVDAEWHPLLPHATLVESLHAPLPARLRPGNPELARAWRALFGYRHDDAAPEHAREVAEAKRRARLAQGEAYPSWILDRLGIETALANRVALGPGVNLPRFRWVAFADALIFPLGTNVVRAESPERRAFLEAVARGRNRIMNALGVGSVPGTLPEYLEEVVTPMLERVAQEGAVAVKFEAINLRAPERVNEYEARRIYAQYAWGAEPPAREYEELQAFLVRYIALEASRLGLAVHVHTGTDLGVSVGLRGARPALLGWLFDDALVGWTNFVLVQGGWPHTAEVAALLGRSNVYADVSAQAYALSAPMLAGSLRPWLELYPEKVLFGTGALPLSSDLGWEELAWLGVTTTRRALAIALSAMVEDGVVSRPRAAEIARMVLRDNAVALYRLPPP